ncbi:MAG: hypothetical protein WC637_08955 [Victivallales bacterium]|jgi:hypothetical protein
MYRFNFIVILLSIHLLSGCACICNVQEKSADGNPAVNSGKAPGDFNVNECVIKEPADKLDENTLAFLGTRVFAYDCAIPKGMGCITWSETTVESKTVLFASEYIFSANKGDKTDCPVMPAVLLRYDPDIITGSETAKGVIDMSWNSVELLGKNKMLMDDYPLKKVLILSEGKCMDFPIKCEVGKIYRVYGLDAETGKGKKVCISVYCAFFPNDAFSFPSGSGYFENYGQFSQVLSRDAVETITKAMAQLKKGSATSN